MSAIATTRWTRDHIGRIADTPVPQFAIFGHAAAPPVVAGHWLWDFWPAETATGNVAAVGGGELWFALSSPQFDDPAARHAAARIRLLHRLGEAWQDLGPLFPDDYSPGSREWSGSAIVEDDRLTVYFTAAGTRGDAVPTFRQRVFSASRPLDPAAPSSGRWDSPVECFASDNGHYALANQTIGKIGEIEAFRDPAFFRDPTDGRRYLLFTGSLRNAGSNWRGCIGLAVQAGDGWSLLPPLIAANDVNQELERPHIRVVDGEYRLYWSTQRSVFATGLDAPTGLYAMVAPALAGPWRPSNGSGLIAANPVEFPDQAYSWWVCTDGRIASFVDVVDTFGGRLAPFADAFDFRH